MVKRPNERIDPGLCFICGNGAGFRGGGREQVPSLPVHDPLTSNENGVYIFYTPPAIYPFEQDYCAFSLLHRCYTMGFQIPISQLCRNYSEAYTRRDNKTAAPFIMLKGEDYVPDYK